MKIISFLLGLSLLLSWIMSPGNTQTAQANDLAVTSNTEQPLEDEPAGKALPLACGSTGVPSGSECAFRCVAGQRILVSGSARNRVSFGRVSVTAVASCDGREIVRCSNSSGGLGTSCRRVSGTAPSEDAVGRCVVTGSAPQLQSVSFRCTTVPLKAFDAQGFLPSVPLRSDVDNTFDVFDKQINGGGFSTTADGTSRLVLHLDQPPEDSSTNEVTFEISGAAERNGGFAVDLTSPPRSSLTVPFTVFETETGKVKRAVIVYVPPKQFVSAQGDQRLRTRIARFRIRPNLTDPEEPFPIILYRLPIVFVHGLMSDSDTWNNARNRMAGDGISRDDLVSIDYRNQNTSGLDKVFRLIPDAIRRIMIDRRTRPSGRIATTQVDVIAHSQGGLLTKWFIADIKGDIVQRSDRFRARLGTTRCNGPDRPCDIILSRQDQDIYARDENFGPDQSNFNEGDIRRFITIGTPFAGSHVLNKLVSSDLCFATFRILPSVHGDLAAVDDLNVGSRFLQILNRAPQDAGPRTYSIRTISLDDLIDWDFLAGRCLLLGRTCSDRAVSLDSQRGSEEWIDFQRISHTSQTGNQEIHDWLLFLINRPGGDSVFGDMIEPIVSDWCCQGDPVCNER